MDITVDVWVRGDNHATTHVIRPVHREPRAGDLPFSRADIAKAERLLGYRPQVRIVQGLRRTIDWYADHLLETANAA